MDLRIGKIFTPEQELALEQIVKKCLHFMDASVLRKRAIQNIQAKIAAIEKAELNSMKRKKKGQKFVMSFQNSVGCSVRMSDGFSTISEKPLPIINTKRRRKKKKSKPASPVHAKTTVISLRNSSSSLSKSDNCNSPENSSPIININKEKKALKSITLTCTKATVIPLQNSSSPSIQSNNCNILSEDPSPIIINLGKKKEALKPVSQTHTKTTVISLQSSSSLLKKSNNCNTVPENSTLFVNLGKKKKTLESIRPTRIKTSVKKYVPENARILSHILESKRRWRKSFQKENKNQYQ